MIFATKSLTTYNSEHTGNMQYSAVINILWCMKIPFVQIWHVTLMPGNWPATITTIIPYLAVVAYRMICWGPVLLNFTPILNYKSSLTSVVIIRCSLKYGQRPVPVYKHNCHLIYIW